MMRTPILAMVVACLGSQFALAAYSAAETSPAQFTLRAEWFDRGNLRVSRPGEAYADKYACVWNGGQLPNEVEYDLDFPVTAEYRLSVLYAAADSRPMDIYLDGRKVHRGLAGVTGSWQTSTARWEPQCAMQVAQGKHTVKLLCPGPCAPHISALRFESSMAFPAAWKLDRQAARRATAGGRQIEPPAPRAHRLLTLALSGKELKAEVARAREEYAGSPAARDELLQSAEAVAEPSADWIAQLAVESQRDTLPLSPVELRKMLAHAAVQIDDFRAMPGVAAAFLEAEKSECARLTTEVEQLLKEPESKEKWQRFFQAYLATHKLQSRVTLSNPLLDFDRLLVVKRSVNSPALGLPQNWQSNCVLPAAGFDNEIAVLSPLGPGGALGTLHRPKGPHFVGDVDLDFDGGKLLFSSIGSLGRWQIFEMKIDGGGLRQVTPGDQADVDNYDACYLPDGRIIFSSTAFMAAVPCVNGSTRVANFYRMDADGRNIRQLCFDQEHNWCPTVLPNGRVLYLRWEYTDTPHAHDRVLFHMNPDGTEQMEYYGSNSYWPNSLFYARPVPGHATKFVGIVGGHHGVPRMGELVLFDAAKGRREAEGVIQRIPGRGKPVEPLIEDNLVDNSWPKFLHPYPLNDKYFLVASQPTPQSLWGIYLVDVYDNMFLLKEEPGYALLEPVPVRRTPRPPVLPDRVDLTRKDGVVYLADVYAGGGLTGIPRGTVKKLRLFTYHFLYPGMGGPQAVVGMEGPWDIKRTMGTVPVEEDGSAVFRVPANTPISMQPLDAEGKALQLMRSWFTAMPGEIVSCVGCHEGQNSSPPNRATLAARRAPSEIALWRGPERGFNFAREVQPVLDRFCIGCHDGQARGDGRKITDLRGREKITDFTSVFHHGGVDAGHFSTSYAELHRYVRRPGMESDYRMLVPMEFHADTTLLVRMLAKGHHGVTLDAEAWDRLITWIDLNAPYHGTWTEIAGPARVQPLAQRRRELLKLYAGMDSDPEAIPPTPRTPVQPIMPEAEVPRNAAVPGCAGWPFDATEAQRRQAAGAPGAAQRKIDLGDGVSMDLVWVPAGRFVMGDARGCADERPLTAVEVSQGFWMGRCEVTNEQFARFDPSHDSRVESRHAMQFGVRGFYVNGPRQPVVRVSWRAAAAYCDWLSAKTGEHFALPTEAQWEYACRAGSDSPFSYGGLESDFSKLANLADLTLKEFVCEPYHKERLPFANPGKYDDWLLKDERFRDGGFVSEDVGRWQANAWGLLDMHGNAAEWTQSSYRPYPYVDGDGRNRPSPEKKVVRGGSWHDRPSDARSAFRLAYPPYQPVFNVGFRVMVR